MFVVFLCSYIWLALLIGADFYFGVHFIIFAGKMLTVVVLACYSLFKYADFSIQINRKVKGGSVGSGGAGVTPTAVNSRLNAKTQFYRRQQRVDELVGDFATALCDLAEMAFDFKGARYDKALLDQFISGLRNKEIRRWMKNERHTTLREALSVAMKYESEFDDEDKVDDSGFDGSFTYSKQNSRCSSPETRISEFCDSALFISDSFSRVRSLVSEIEQDKFEKINVGLFDSGVDVRATRIVERNDGREVFDVVAPRIHTLISSEHEEEADFDLSQLFLVEISDEIVVEEKEEGSMSDENEAAVENEGHVSPISEDELAIPEVYLTVVDFSPIIEEAVYEEEQELFLVESADEGFVGEEEEALVISKAKEEVVEDDEDVAQLVEKELEMSDVSLGLVDFNVSFSPIFEEAVKVDVYQEEQEKVAELEAQLKQESGDIGVFEQGERLINKVGGWKERRNGQVGQIAKLVVEVGGEFSVVNQRRKEGRVAQRWPKLKDKPPDFIKVLFDYFIFVV
jgi:hypothetical protein